eukprot:CAMPEP_0203745376 /NCGR_PEP_ID=MMETSP0098-20131031/1133_1 /ASSEMBLY_ACC=CAM_ASM_000208 /TAXON_ID=96639 /ORGANISM=" , Strain NY0313808BC1" /LENGTH=636 /DNA_ID=CAMNT_0050633131 /DNA_START=188 /DNA_END=2095 /DNA_ORIENTATION=+
MANVPSLSELCANAMLNDRSIDTDAKLQILDRLRNLSQARSAALEKEVEEWNSIKPKAVGPKEIDITELGEQEKEKKKKAQNDWEREQLEEEQEALKYKKVADNAKARRKELQAIFEWKQRFTQLCHKAQVLDRERLAALKQTRNELENDIGEIDKLEVDLARDRKNDYRDMHNQLDKVKWAVGRLIGTVNEMGSGDQYLRDLEQQMEHVERLITSIKDRHRGFFEGLLKKEQVLAQEMERMCEKFDLEEEQDVAGKRLDAEICRQKVIKHRKSVKAATVEHNRNSGSRDAMISSIDQEIADMGGSTGNWDSRDHTVFLRCVSRFKITESMLMAGPLPNNLMDKFVKKAVLEIPTVDENRVTSHLVWYAMYVTLLAKKKRVVQEWKESKQKENSTLHGKHGDKEQVDPNHKTVSKPQRAHLEEYRKEEQERKRQAVSEWKAARDAEKRMKLLAKEAEKRAEEERRAELVMKRRKEREQLALYKLQREAERDRQKKFEEYTQVQQRQQRKHSNNVDLKKRQQRDLELAATRRAVLKEKEKQKQDRASRIAELKVKPAVRQEFKAELRNRGSNGLTQATTAYERKKLTPAELEQIQKRRAEQGAHDSVVPSTAGITMGSKGYGIGVKSCVSGRAMASW